MSIHRTFRRRCALLALLGLVLAGCSPARGPQTGSQTNWLKACGSDDDCGDLKCLCGACTVSCDAEADCADLAGASCVANEDAGAIALCGGCTPSNPGLCLPRCDDAECTDGTACVAGVCIPIAEPAVGVIVDASTRHQTLIGFGASLVYSDDEIAQHPRSEALYDAMFAESGLDILRLRNRYDGDNPEDLVAPSEIFAGASERLGHPPTTMMTAGSPPAALKANGSRDCSGNPDTCTLVQRGDGSFDYAGFAAHWRASLEAYAGVGVVPDYVTIQNNPNWVPTESETLEACRFLPTEGTATVSVDGTDVDVPFPGLAQALEAVANELDGLASAPRIIAPDVTNYEVVPEYAPSLDFSIVDAIGHHLYGTDPMVIDDTALAALGELAQEHDRPLLQTEMREDGFDTAVLMHHVLAAEGAAAYLQNDFVTSAFSLEPDDMALIALTEEDFSLQAPYYALRHYALHTDPGWVRVDAESDDADLLATAWLSPEEDALTVVLVNAGLTEFATQIELDAEAMGLSGNAQVTRTVFDGVERSAELGALPAEGIVQVPGHSIVTVAWQG